MAFLHRLVLHLVKCVLVGHLPFVKGNERLEMRLGRLTRGPKEFLTTP
jgi:hypothetical protein